MRIAVTGQNGQVVSSLRAIADKLDECEIVCLGRPNFDLARPETISEAMTLAHPDVVINAAAWTAVDLAESKANEALAVNGLGAGLVAEATKKLGIPIIQISTDYVFNGQKSSPYSEEDVTDPRSVYGSSKLKGEQLVASANPDHVIARVAWVYSSTGNNFVKTMLRLAETRAELGVVADQIGNPTSADAIAVGLIKIAQNLRTSPNDASLRGIFHMTAQGEASWADFAESIFSAAATKGRSIPTVKRITTADYPTPAARPANSRLNCAKINHIHGVILPPWQQSLSDCIDQLIPA